MIETYGANGGKHVWLGLDPGISTGWAIVGDDTKVLGRGVFSEDQVYGGLDELVRGIHRSECAVTAVIEKMPGTGKMSDLQQRLERVRRLITEIIEEVYEIPTVLISPGEWKTSRVARTTHPNAKTQHEIDASLIALYAMLKEARKRGR